MARFEFVKSSMWDDQWFLSLTQSEAHAFLYTFQNGIIRPSGIYQLALDVWAFYTKNTPEQIRTICKKLIEDGKIRYDYEFGVIWVVNFLRHKPDAVKTNRNTVIAIKKDLADFGKCCFIKEFEGAYKGLCTPPIGIGIGTGTGIKKGEVTGEERIFEHWNLQPYLPHHKTITAHSKGILKALGAHDLHEVLAAITAYNLVLGKPEQYWFEYKWVLGEFCQRGVVKFLEEAKPLENFKRRVKSFMPIPPEVKKAEVKSYTDQNLERWAKSCSGNEVWIDGVPGLRALINKRDGKTVDSGGRR